METAITANAATAWIDNQFAALPAGLCVFLEAMFIGSAHLSKIKKARAPTVFAQPVPLRLQFYLSVKKH
ncbi:hypothetical protein QEV83_03910 [Methylocapsa sp. D3K7]|uniref:hypothetical protein n=1 Tax=Methylocapsa sp. D3K7 TaxID=3041435 RepID=UPI00244EDE37|nr:hypothetical protein [Methylocapsa sp. D3K7]WGJ15435.1 hypothetical protein QEV83_03910 [Methylocapsa sp. D3K7]